MLKLRDSMRIYWTIRGRLVFVPFYFKTTPTKYVYKCWYNKSGIKKKLFERVGLGGPIVYKSSTI